MRGWTILIGTFVIGVMVGPLTAADDRGWLQRGICGRCDGAFTIGGR